MLLFQIGLYRPVVDSQEFVGTSSHVNIVVFAFLPFAVKEAENGIVCRGVL